MIAWPRRRKTGRASLILCGDLVRAVETESEIAVAHWWGVSVTTVWAWRKALGVGRITNGTARLYHDYQPEKLPELVGAIGRERAKAPDAVAAMRASKRGQPAAPATRVALLHAAQQPKSDGWRQALSERNRRRGRPASWRARDWQPQEDRILGTMPDRAAAQSIGRTLPAVRQRRLALGIPAFGAAR